MLNTILLFLFYFLISFLATYFWSFGINYYSHYRMSIKESKERLIGRGTYEDFKNRFELIKNWEYSSNYENSLFLFNKEKCGIDGTYYKIAYIHASMIIFNENLMLLGPFDYFKARILIKQKIKELKGPNKNKKIKKWSEVESEEILNKIANN